MERKTLSKVVITSLAIVLTLIIFSICMFKVSYVMFRRVVYIIYMLPRGHSIEITYYTLTGKYIKKIIDTRFILTPIIILLISIIALEIKHRDFKNIAYIYPTLAILVEIPSLIISIVSPLQQLVLVILLLIYEYYILRSYINSLLEISYIVLTFITIFSLAITCIGYTFSFLKLLWIAAIFESINNLSIYLAFAYLLSSVIRFVRPKGCMKMINEEINTRLCRFFTILGIVLTVVFSILPFTPLLNPKQVPISVDTYYYYRWLITIEKHGLLYAYITDLGLRPLYLTILYLVHVAGLPISIIAKYHIIPLLIFYTIMTYFFTKTLFNNDLIASIAVFTCPLSIIFMTFLYGGFHANLFALSILMISIILLFKADNVRSKMFYIACFLSIIILLIHPWVWIQIMAGLLVYTIYIRFKGDLRLFEKLKIFLIICSIFGVIRLLYHIKALRSVAMPVIGVVTTKPLTYVPLLMWYQFNILVWGTISVAFYYMACICSILYLKRENMPLNYLDALLLVSIFPFFTQPLRIIMNTFPQIFMAVFLYSIYRTFRGRLRLTMLILISVLLLFYGIYWIFMAVPSYSHIPWNIENLSSK